MDSIFSRGKKSSTARRPQVRTKRNTATLPMSAPVMHSAVPPQKPKV